MEKHSPDAPIPSATHVPDWVRASGQSYPRAIGFGVRTSTTGMKKSASIHAHHTRRVGAAVDRVFSQPSLHGHGDSDGRRHVPIPPQWVECQSVRARRLRPHAGNPPHYPPDGGRPGCGMKLGLYSVGS